MQKYPKKLVAVLNEKVSIGVVMNALAHMAIGLGASIENKQDLKLVDYVDGDGNSHPNISELPFIILKSSGQGLKDLRKDLAKEGINFLDFPDFINSIGTFESPEKSREFKEENSEYYGIVMFDDWDAVTEKTRKFSLWR